MRNEPLYECKRVVWLSCAGAFVYIARREKKIYRLDRTMSGKMFVRVPMRVYLTYIIYLLAPHLCLSSKIDGSGASGVECKQINRYNIFALSV